MNKDQLKAIIETTLKNVDLYSDNAVDLLLGTSAQESHLGEYVYQINGPAKGIFQMEPETFKDILANYLYYHPKLTGNILNECNVIYLNPDCLTYNLKVSIIFARLQYYRQKEALPTTIEGMSKYWKKYYNTILGKGTEAEFISNYSTYVNV